MYPILGVLGLALIVAGVYLYRRGFSLRDFWQKVGGFIDGITDRISKS